MVIKLDPDDAAAYRARGYAYYYDGQYERAMADFSKALELDPGDSAAYHARLLATLRWYTQQRIVWAIAAAVLIPLIALIGNHRLNNRAKDYLNEHLDKAIKFGAPEIYRELQREEQDVKKEKQIDRSLVFTLDALSQGYYDWLKVDDRAVDAIKFALGKGDHGFEDIYNAASRAAESDAAFDRLLGYVGEQIAAKDLAEQGCVVSFPDSPTQEGYDLIVDGTPLQVKTTLAEHHIRNALEMHPDISVLAPYELLDSPIATENVIFTPNFTHELTEYIADDSIEAINDLGIEMPIPILTVAYVGYREIKKVRHGKEAQQALFEGTTKVLLVSTGGKLGAVVGLGTGAAAISAGIGSYVSWGAAASVGITVGSSIAAAAGAKYGLVVGGAAFLILGPLGAVAVAAAGTMGGAWLGRVLGDWIIKKLKFRGHMDVIEPVVTSAQRCRKLLLHGLRDRLVALQTKRSKILSRVLVPGHRRADRLIKKKLRSYFDEDAGKIQSTLWEISSKADLNLQHNEPPERVVKTDKEIEFTRDLIKDNFINSKDLALEADEFRLSAEAFYTFLIKRGLMDKVQDSAGIAHAV
jgi:tetratricopeptide (TPR) repeat protein